MSLPILYIYSNVNVMSNDSLHLPGGHTQLRACRLNWRTPDHRWHNSAISTPRVEHTPHVHTGRLLQLGVNIVELCVFELLEAGHVTGSSGCHITGRFFAFASATRLRLVVLVCVCARV